MEHKHESETLRQQRKARAEWLKLKQMQQSGEIEHHSPEAAVSAPATRREALKNYWFYYGKATLIVAALVAVAAFFTVQCALKPATDYQIAVFDYHYVLDTYLDQMKDLMAPVSADVTGDGTVVIQTVNCTFEQGQSTAERQQTCMQKLQGQISVETSTALYITGADTYDYVNGLTEGGLLYEFHPFTEAFYAQLQPVVESQPPAGLGIAVKRVEGTLMEKSEKANRAEAEAHALIDSLRQAGYIA